MVGVAHALCRAQRDGVGDLQKAAKLFFEQGDTESYRQAQQYIKQALGAVEEPLSDDDVSSEESSQNDDVVTVSNLFHAPSMIS